MIHESNCITHHNACNCREARFRRIEEENNQLRERLTWKPIETLTEDCWPFLIARFIGQVFDECDLRRLMGKEPWKKAPGYGGYTHYLLVPPLLKEKV